MSIFNPSQASQSLVSFGDLFEVLDDYPTNNIFTTAVNDLEATKIEADSIDTLTNKTVGASTNIITADFLETASGQVNVASATAPLTGQVLQATNATNATWQTLPSYITASSPDTLTNKSIDADQNTITNIDNSDIKIGAVIDATKIANGTVSNAEYQFINSLSSNCQTQINNRVTVNTNQTIPALTQKTWQGHQAFGLNASPSLNNVMTINESLITGGVKYGADIRINSDATAVSGQYITRGGNYHVVCQGTNYTGSSSNTGFFACTFGLGVCGHASNLDIKAVVAVPFKTVGSNLTCNNITGVETAVGTDLLGTTGVITATNSRGLHVKDGSAGHNPVNNYGVYIDEITRGTNIWSLYIENNRSFFGGNIEMTKNDPKISIQCASPMGSGNFQARSQTGEGEMAIGVSNGSGVPYPSAVQGTVYMRQTVNGEAMQFVYVDSVKQSITGVLTSMYQNLDMTSNSIINASIDASLIDSGTLANARITAGNITQHEGSIDITNLLNYSAGGSLDWTLDQGANNINDANIVASSISQHTGTKDADNGYVGLDTNSNARIENTASGGIPLKIIAHASQTGDLLQIKNNAESVDWFSVSNSGEVKLTNINYGFNTADGSAVARTLYVTTSAGTPLSYKDTGGTARRVVMDTLAQTLTNKTLTSPIISTISNSGTLTLPSGADTIVARTSTDILSNKTFSDVLTVNNSVQGANLILNSSSGTPTSRIIFRKNNIDDITLGNVDSVGQGLGGTQQSDGWLKNEIGKMFFGGENTPGLILSSTSVQVKLDIDCDNNDINNCTTINGSSIPSTIVGTSEAQTLSNKDFSDQVDINTTTAAALRIINSTATASSITFDTTNVTVPIAMGVDSFGDGQAVVADDKAFNIKCNGASFLSCNQTSQKDKIFCFKPLFLNDNNLENVSYVEYNAITDGSSVDNSLYVSTTNDRFHLKDNSSIVREISTVKRETINITFSGAYTSPQAYNWEFSRTGNTISYAFPNMIATTTNTTIISSTAGAILADYRPKYDVYTKLFIQENGANGGFNAVLKITIFGTIFMYKDDTLTNNWGGVGSSGALSGGGSYYTDI